MRYPALIILLRLFMQLFNARLHLLHLYMSPEH